MPMMYWSMVLMLDCVYTILRIEWGKMMVFIFASVGTVKLVEE
jgi:hypothetical protein